jgi:hypothetical protein
MITPLAWSVPVLPGGGGADETPVSESPSNPTARAPATGSPSGPLCYGGYTIAAVHLAPVHIPGQTIPGMTIGGVYYPPQKLPPVDLPGQTIPAQRVPRECVDAAALAGTTVRISNYSTVDRLYDPSLTETYWSSSEGATMPDFSAPGFGELNAAGFPKNQYVRPYVRRDGTFVSGYWRNSPSDGLPTCRVITC